MSGIKKKNTQVGLLVMVLIFLGYSTSRVMTYIKYKNYRENAIKIAYTISSYEKHSGGRGSYYTSKILYNNKAYSIGITESMLDSMQNGDIPTVYYNVNNDIALTDWDLLSRKRASIIMVCITSILLVLVYGKYVKSMIFKK